MPYRVHFNKEPEGMKNLSDENMEAMALFKRRHGVLKSLGVQMRTDSPDSTATGKAKVQQVIARLAKMNMRGLDDKSIAIVINSLVILLAQFAALESNISIEDCNLIDRTIVNKISKGHSLAKNDMKDIMFVSHRKMGMNVRSFLGTMLAAKARELECGLNGEMQYCASFRARWQAWAIREENNEQRNPFDYLEHGLIESNVRFLARYGIYLRDKKY